VFGNDVIIFSDKSCGYRTPAALISIGRAGTRRRSLTRRAKSLKQNAGSAFLRKKVFLDAKCLDRRPINLPNASDMRVHRICVALRALDRAEAETSTRSLKIEAAVLNDAVRLQ
jgi:hypothetical protein